MIYENVILTDLSVIDANCRKPRNVLGSSRDIVCNIRYDILFFWSNNLIDFSFKKTLGLISIFQ